MYRERPYVSQKTRVTLYSPSVGTVSPWELTPTLTEVAVESSAKVRLSAEVESIEETGTGYSVEANQGVIGMICICNAADVFAGEANETVDDATSKIEPNRGEYYLLDKGQGSLVNHAIFQYPNENGGGILAAPTVYDNLIVGLDSRPTSREGVSATAEGLSYVRNTALKSIPDINFHESIRNFADIRVRTKGDDFFVYEGPENRLFYNIAGMASPGLSFASVTMLDVIETMRESGLPLTKKEAYMDTRSAIRSCEMGHKERMTLIREHLEYRKIICRCEAVIEGEIINAVHHPVPAVPVNAVKHRCNAEMGRCQNDFCGSRVQEVIARELKKNLKDVPLDRKGATPITEEAEVTGGEQE